SSARATTSTRPLILASRKISFWRSCGNILSESPRSLLLVVVLLPFVLDVNPFGGTAPRWQPTRRRAARTQLCELHGAPRPAGSEEAGGEPYAKAHLTR